MQSGGISNVLIALINLLLHEHGCLDTHYFGIGPDTTFLYEFWNCLIAGRIFKDAKIILVSWLWPNGNVSNVRLREEVHEFRDGTWEDVGDLRCPVPNFREHELFEFMQQDNNWLQNRIA